MIGSRGVIYEEVSIYRQLDISHTQASGSRKSVADLCREYGMSSASFYQCRSKYGGMDASLIRRLKELEAENSRLNKMYAEERIKRESDDLRITIFITQFRRGTCPFFANDRARAFDFFVLFALSVTPMAKADNEENAMRLFEFAETEYSFGVQTPMLLEDQGYFGRYYPSEKVYLGVLGDKVYALGGSIGDDLTLVGTLNDFIATTAVDITDAVLSNWRAQCSYYAD